MADLGSIANKGLLTKASAPLGPIRYLKVIQCENQSFYLGSKSTTEGDPAQPSLKIDAYGMLRFRWTVESGARTISINVKQAINLSPRPTLVVKKNTEIGVNADVTGTAASSTGWVTIGPVTINPTSDGAVWVEIHSNYDGEDAPSYWDHVVTT